MLRIIFLSVFCLLAFKNSFGNNIILPVHSITGISFIKFGKLEATPSNKVIHFKWEVQAESKGDYFLIEKSIDGDKWKKISKINSLKNHSDLHTYLTSEINLTESAHETFRIKRVDADGEISILDKIEVMQEVLSNLFLIPVAGKANKQMIVSYNSLICSNGKIDVINEEGQTVYSRKVHFREGYNRFILITKEYRKEEYYARVTDQYGNFLSKRFVLAKGVSRRSKF